MGFTILGTYISMQQIVLFFVILLIISMIKKPVIRFLVGLVLVWFILGFFGIREQTMFLIRKAFNAFVHFISDGVY